VPRANMTSTSGQGSADALGLVTAVPNSAEVTTTAVPKIRPMKLTLTPEDVAPQMTRVNTRRL